MLLLLLSLPLQAALAKDYMIEIVVFENMKTRSYPGANRLYVPRLHNAIGLKSDKAASMGFAMLDNPVLLEEEAAAIRQSGRFRLLHHFTWRQPGLSDKDTRPIRINIGSAVNVSIPDNYQQYDSFIPARRDSFGGGDRRDLTTTTISGTLEVSLGRFLHLHALLAYTDAEAGVTYRMDHQRKMRSRELHYIDNPKFGLLAKIVPLDDE